MNKDLAMILSWLDAKEAKDFGAMMARFYIDRMPVNTGLNEKQFAIKSQQVLEKMNHHVIDFRRKKKLNVYKIAQMGNAFKWVLRDAGYDERYIDKITEWLVAKIQ